MKDAADIFQAILTGIAIIVGGVWSWLLFVRTRQKYPRAAIKHEISHRKMGDGFVLLNVSAIITNNGQVLLSIAFADTRVQQVLPSPPELLVALKKGEDPVKKGECEYEWPLLFSRQSDWGKEALQIEPGESDRIDYDFVLEGDVRTVEVYTYLRNEKIRKREIGWNLTTLYDIAT